MIAITGATGQLGRLVIAALLTRVAPDQIVAVVRDPAKAADLAEKGVIVRQGDYAQPESLVPAFAGVEKLLLISSNEVGQRATQHLAVIEAAKAAGVSFIAYTSLLRADTSLMLLAEEHLATELALAASGIPFTLLRNGWYTENYAGVVPAAIEHSALFGSAGEGRFSTAARADYAEAAAIVLSTEGHAGKTYELAGDTSFSLAELAAEIGRRTGKTVVYNDLPQDEYKALLVQIGFPEGYAAILADSDARAAQGALEDRTGALGQLIGRPTQPYTDWLGSVLA